MSYDVPYNNIRQFFDFAKERQKIFLKRKKGQKPPWTEDEVIQAYRFCNIFREDDRNTRWFRENLRDPLKKDPKVFMATVAFRWFNKIETGECLKFMLKKPWNRKHIEKKLSKRRDDGEILFTGAYIIRGPDGMQKLEGILDCIDNLAVDAKAIVRDCLKEHYSLEDMHAVLMEYDYMGPFIAYEVVTDLRHTYLLDKAKDINTWASSGPGCARGLGWLVYDDPDHYGYGSKSGQDAMLALMIELLKCSKTKELWPKTWPKWELREVEHTLCEYDKWRRGHEGQRLKRRYSFEGD